MKLFYEKGAIDFGDKYLSPRITTELLNNYLNISVVDQKSFYLKIGIIRFARLYGFPFIGPHPKVEIWIDNTCKKLRYKFYWPEYYYLILMAIMVVFTGIKTGALTEMLIFVPIALCFFGTLIFLDTRWVVSKFRKAVK